MDWGLLGTRSVKGSSEGGTTGPGSQDYPTDSPESWAAVGWLGEHQSQAAGTFLGTGTDRAQAAMSACGWDQDQMQGGNAGSDAAMGYLDRVKGTPLWLET